ncbi:cupin domain-containing protein [Actinomycetospora straminea]|uniref:Cupin domain-containing protein n=1 Tax=Actinomycetospora straminea TaxID=663607 RepID=A0ABP9EPC0_9PSEU|nr:cupin domain-containing protein [Actinomycetospora straminea]MDD7935454.1 cupin domain-containing protein [Actinomycetospora straminea]
MTVQLPPVAVHAGEGQELPSPTGDRITVKLGTGDTAGALSAVEIVNSPSSGPPLHIHRREDEVWWILEGHYRFRVGDTLVDLEPGGMAFGPRDVPHAFANVGESPGRLLVITTPGGLEQFFERSAALRATTADPQRLTELGLAHGLEFIGPPLRSSVAGPSSSASSARP